LRITDAAILLRPLTEEDRAAFFAEEIANYADQKVRDAGWSPHEAHDRARREFGPELEREYVRGVAAGDRLWSAVPVAGADPVGWLWVTAIPGAPESQVYLEQITVAQDHRRRGYGSAILAALEALLAREGCDELRLDVYVANEAGQALYAAAGYEEVGRNERQVRLRKRLTVREGAL
jgi:ribosomal protein S18 acetylase RimI-like enzyme